MKQLVLTILYKGIMPVVLKVMTGITYKNRNVLSQTKQFVIIANHNSHLDTLALLSAMPNTRLISVKPVAAADYFGSGKIKSFLTRFFTNALLIPRCCSLRDKRKDPFRIMMKALKRGESLIVYPEGTRGQACEMQEFKTGIAHVLLKYPHIPYIPVYIENTGKVLPKNKRIPVPYNCRVVFGEAQFCKGSAAKEVVGNMYNEVCGLKAA